MQQKSSTSGEIQEFRLAEANPQGSHSYRMLAFSILKNTLVDAAFAIIHTNGKLNHSREIQMATSKQALAFLMGTGLDIMLQSYDLDYSADELRESFYQTFHIKASC